MDRTEIRQLEKYLKTLFGLDSLTVRSRNKQTDSVEVYIGEEFVAVIYRDEDEGEVSWNFQMAILPLDLEEA